MSQSIVYGWNIDPNLDYYTQVRGFDEEEELPPFTFEEDLDPFYYGEDAWAVEDIEFESSERPDADLSFISQVNAYALEILQEQNIPVCTSFSDQIGGMEVGDDRVDVSPSSLRLALELSIQELVFAMKTSKEDTFITNDLWNFCETTEPLPCAPEQGFDYARKTGSFKDISFYDSPPLRLLSDVTKTDGSHSSTSVGKARMLASRISSCRPDIRNSLHIASLLQDTRLGTAKAPDPKYLPYIMGGSGVPSLFDSHRNMYLYVQSYKSGTYQRLYGTATNELMGCLSELSRGIASVPRICFKLRDKQEYLHGTYAEKILYPSDKARATAEGSPLPQPLYEAHSGQVWITSVENRLIRTNHLIGRTGAELEMEKTLRSQDVLFGWKTVATHALEQKRKSSAAREKFGGALRANSAFQRLLSRNATGQEVDHLLGQDFRLSTWGKSEFSIIDAHWLLTGGKGEFFSIADFTLKEDMFSFEEVSTEEAFRVGGITLRIPTRTGIRVRDTVPKIGLYEISKGMQEWAENQYQKLHAMGEIQRPIPIPTLHMSLTEDLEWVNDDTGLIGRALIVTADYSDKQPVILLSSDKRLAKKMSRTVGCPVYRVEPVDVLLQPNFGNWSSETKVTWDQLQRILPRDVPAVPDHLIFIDSGSVLAASVKLADAPRSEGKYLRTLRSYSNTNGVRTAVRHVEHIPSARRIRLQHFYADENTAPFKRQYALDRETRQAYETLLDVGPDDQY